MAKRVAGDSIVLENQRYRHTRHGILEDLWFNLSYSPVHDEDGTVAGILAIGLNTTPQVLAEQAKSEAEGRLRRVLERSRKKSALFMARLEVVPSYKADCLWAELSWR
jgi:PAS domain-containing protein